MSKLLSILSDKLTAAGISNKAEAAESMDVDDDITINTPSAEGFEISIQVANDFSPRCAPVHSVNAWNEKEGCMYHLEQSKCQTPDMVVKTIQSLIDGDIKLA